MKAAMAVGGLAVAMLAACGPMPQQSQAPPPPVAEADTEIAGASTGAPDKPGDLQESEMKALPPTDVRVMKCSLINSASDDDKAYASTFLLGYRSAMIHAHVIDTKQIDTILQAAVADCASKPDALAYKVFAAAQMKAAGVEHPPHVVHQRLRPPTPAAATTAVPTPTETAPPMRYAPAAAPLPDQSATPSTEKPGAPDKPAPPAPASDDPQK